MGNTEGDDSKTTPGPNPALAGASFLAGLDFVADGNKAPKDDSKATPIDPGATFLAGMDWEDPPPNGEGSKTDPDELDDDGDAGRGNDENGEDAEDDEDDDDWDSDGDSDVATEAVIADPNGIENFNYVLLGNIRKDWPDEDSDHIEPACLDDAYSVRIFIAWLENSIAIRIGEQLTEFRLDPETDEDGDIAREQLRSHVRSSLEAHPQWRLQGETIEEAITMITATDLDDVLDGDEDERGWRCDSGQYEVSGWNGSWGELFEDGEEADYTGGFYLSAVAFTNREQAGDAANLRVTRDAHGDLESVDLLAAVSELDHSYVIGARKKATGIAGTSQATIPVSPPQPLATARAIELTPSMPTRPHVSEQSGTRPAAPAKSTNWIALIIVAGLVLAGLMYAYSTLIAPNDAVPQAPDTPQVVISVPETAGSDAALREDAAPTREATSATETSAGFDCAKASTDVETMICGSPQLSALDAMLGANYRNVMSADIGAAQQAELKAAQRHWLTQRDACHDMRCLADAYMQRIDAICEYRPQSGKSTPCVRLQPDAQNDAGSLPTTEQTQIQPESMPEPTARRSDPGFDCSMHKGVVEQAICADVQLGDLHREMAQKYAALSYVGASGDVLKASQNFWMESRDRCRDKNCLVEAYTQRIHALDEYAASRH